MTADDQPRDVTAILPSIERGQSRQLEISNAIVRIYKHYVGPWSSQCSYSPDR